MQNSKKLKGEPLETVEIFRKKNITVPKENRRVHPSVLVTLKCPNRPESSFFASSFLRQEQTIFVTN